MEKVIGNAKYSVYVTCLNCGCYFDVIDQDDDSLVCDAMFTNTDESCTDMDIEIVCPECDAEMILDKLEY